MFTLRRIGSADALKHFTKRAVSALCISVDRKIRGVAFIFTKTWYSAASANKDSEGVSA